MPSAIYAIVNQTTLDMYVGSAVNVARRWAAHRGNLRRKTHHCAHLQNSYEKYGAGNFDWEIVEFVDDKARLIEREQFWIDFFRPTYNKRTIANSCLGLKRSVESRQRMSEAQKGKKQTPESVTKRAAAIRGIPRSAETRAKISQSHMGIRPNAETRAKMSLAAKARKRK